MDWNQNNLNTEIENCLVDLEVLHSKMARNAKQKTFRHDTAWRSRKPLNAGSSALTPRFALPFRSALPLRKQSSVDWNSEKRKTGKSLPWDPFVRLWLEDWTIG